MDQERPEIDIAAFADPQQSGFTPGRVLPGDETEPGGKLAPILKLGRITDRGDQGCRTDGSNARNGL